MMNAGFRKLFGTTFLPLVYTSHQITKKDKQNECDGPDAHAMQDAEAL
jgi:hypothetical protein